LHLDNFLGSHQQFCR